MFILRIPVLRTVLCHLRLKRKQKRGKENARKKISQITLEKPKLKHIKEMSFRSPHEEIDL